MSDREYLYKEYRALQNAKQYCDNPKLIHRESVCFNIQMCGKCEKCLARKSCEIFAKKESRLKNGIK